MLPDNIGHYCPGMIRKIQIWMLKCCFSLSLFYAKNEINTPAATALPITPEILLDMAY